MSGWVYITASRKHGALYVGVTNDLARRIHEHRERSPGSFTTRYGVTRLVWYEPYATMPDAIVREKAIKRWSRAWKLQLIERMNPEWADLYDNMTASPAPMDATVEPWHDAGGRGGRGAAAGLVLRPAALCHGRAGA